MESTGQYIGDNLIFQIVITIILFVVCVDFISHSGIVLHMISQLFPRSKAILYTSLYLLMRLSVIPTVFIFNPWPISPKETEDRIIEIAFYFMYGHMGMNLLYQFASIFANLYSLYKMGIKGTKMKSNFDVESSYPMVVILMPIYNEEPNALFRAVESAVRSDYPSSKKHVFLAFDEEKETSLYLALMKKLRILSKDVTHEIEMALGYKGNNDKNTPIFPPKLEWVIEGVRVTVCRFPHEGKSPTQGKAFKIINSLYGEKSAENSFLLFIDSDIILHDNAIHNFISVASQNPEIKGLTGLITCRTSRKFNFYQYLQDAEYIEGQMFVRSLESILGAVSCLPGALTMIRLDCLQKVAPKYFIRFDKTKNIDFHRYHLGEDRYMTYLLTEMTSGPHQVIFVSSATCKTDAPDGYRKLLKQRRRWMLGALPNDVLMIFSGFMWRRFPLLTFLRFYMYASGGMNLSMFLFLIYASIGMDLNPIFVLTFALIGLKYVILFIESFLMTRGKVIICSLLVYFLNPVFFVVVMGYSVWTWGVRSWGGPRTDDDNGSEKRKVSVLREAMDVKEDPVGRTRKSLWLIKNTGRLIECSVDGKISSTPDDMSDAAVGDASSVRSIRMENGSQRSLRQDKLLNIKKVIPFPYESEFLGTGGPTESTNRQFLSPPVELKSSSSLPNLTILAPESETNHEEHYIFNQLNLETRKRVSSFRLATNELAKVQSLLSVHSEDSHRRNSNSSFSSRLANRGRSFSGSSNSDNVTFAI